MSIFIIHTGKFQKFHYNETKNMEMYGSQQPPEYDLSKITANIHILYGTNDRIAPAEVSLLLVSFLFSFSLCPKQFQKQPNLSEVFNGQLYSCACVFISYRRIFH